MSDRDVKHAPPDVPQARLVAGWFADRFVPGRFQQAPHSNPTIAPHRKEVR